MLVAHVVTVTNVIKPPHSKYSSVITSSVKGDVACTLFVISRRHGALSKSRENYIVPCSFRAFLTPLLPSLWTLQARMSAKISPITRVFPGWDNPRFSSLPLFQLSLSLSLSGISWVSLQTVEVKAPLNPTKTQRRRARLKKNTQKRIEISRK